MHANAPLPQGSLEGYVIMKNYHLNNQPVLSDLLNLSSISGLADYLSGKGLWVDKLIADISFDDGLLDIYSAEMLGPSVGVHMKGQVEFVNKLISIGGTIAPFNFIARSFQDVPILSTLLSGARNEGLFAAEFTVIGSLKNPQLTVNPLSVLTPGIFRDFFTELGTYNSNIE